MIDTRLPPLEFATDHNHMFVRCSDANAQMRPTTTKGHVDAEVKLIKTPEGNYWNSVNLIQTPESNDVHHNVK